MNQKLKNNYSALKKTIFLVALLLSVTCSGFSQDIFEAARHNDIASLAKFLKAGTKIDTADQRGSTPLIIAVYNENEEAAKFLLDNGALTDAKDKSGNTAMMGACFKGYLNMVELLYQYHAIINTLNLNHASALIFAATFGQLKIAAYLLEKGADRNIRDNRDKSALDYAINQEYQPMIDLLKK
ncbi:hypothetical protein HDF26_003175 [Pedobacter cryoconitis]|uniref:ankyrin repeat domain-containing protein n=1 Tax=Pedobacter cryoconitis TaxID=188932 RepID=UPI001803DD0B|nr:ankyrin repeat domain-containing protein [Pedobacter cryoconitis]MBB6272718.1 hypothetical protein [Pedobacter cryoconitis]